MEATAKTNNSSAQRQRVQAAVLAALALIVGYLFASRAIDTGSLGEYFLALVALIFAINRVLVIFKRNKS